MSGLVNKVKDVLHKDKDTTHTDNTTGGSLYNATSGSRTEHGTLNPADRNNDGTVNARDLTAGQHGSTGGIGSHNTTHGSTGGLAGHGNVGTGASGLIGQHSSTGGLTDHSTTGHGVAGNDAFMGQGYDATGPHNTRTANVLDPHVQGGAQSGLAGHGTTGHSTSGVAGHTGAGGLTSGGHQQTGLGGAQSGLSHGTTGNTMTGSLDRNNDGRINAGDLAPGAHGHSSLGGAGQTATGGVGHTGAEGVGQTGLDARDSTAHGHPSHGHTSNPLDRNNDGKVDAHDLKGNQSSGAQGSSHVVTGVKKGNELEHRTGESGDLPKALTEPYSKAEPHHGTGLEPAHTTGRETRASSSMKDKLDPKTDADRDGKAGVMD